MANKVQIQSLPHIVLHYDLDTPQGANRSDVSTAIDAITKPTVPRKLTESVRLLVAPPGVEPFTFAIDAWKAVAEATKGKLRVGDAFFIHLMWGGAATVFFQRVDASHVLDQDPLATVFESMLKA